MCRRKCNAMEMSCKKNDPDDVATEHIAQMPLSRVCQQPFYNLAQQSKFSHFYTSLFAILFFMEDESVLLCYNLTFTAGFNIRYFITRRTKCFRTQSYDKLAVICHNELKKFSASTFPSETGKFFFVPDIGFVICYLFIPVTSRYRMKRYSQNSKVSFNFVHFHFVRFASF